MNDHPLISLDDQRSRLEKIVQLVAERVRVEAGLRASRAARDATLTAQLTGDQQRLVARQQAERDGLRSEHATRLSQIAREYELTVEQATAENEREYRQISADTEKKLTAARAHWDDVQLRLKSNLAATVQDLQQGLREFKERVEERRQELRELDEQGWKVVRRRRCQRAAAEVAEKHGICDPNAPLESYPRDVAAAQRALQEFAQHLAPKLLAGGVQVGMLMAICFLGVALGVYVDRLGWPWYAAVGTVAIGSLAILRVAVRPLLVRQTVETFGIFRQAIANADIALDAAVTLRAADADSKKIAAQQQCDLGLRKATLDHQSRVDVLGVEREAALREASERLQARRKAAVEVRDAKQRDAHQKFSSDLQRQQETHATQLAQAEERQRAEVGAAQEIHQRGWQRMAAHWQAGLQEFDAAVEQMWKYCDERFPPWDAVQVEALPPQEETLPALNFGKFTFNLRALEGGVPTDEDLLPPRIDFVLPAVLSFATRPSLLFEAWGEGRAVAIRSLQNVMLRLLTALPPGKVRFTIIDPVGLGQNFSAFMHLADFDEKLITHRIWTETQHIQQRLADLTEHMEDVIQTYLRNEFPTIDEYNRQAGEVAEPFHVLVVANFPAGFTDDAAQRLLSIMHTGSRCGVYSLISTDSKLELPRNFDLADLETHAATVQWNGQRFSWRDESLKDLPLTLDEPPEPERLTQLIRLIGARAKDAIRVEVPFSTVACPPNAWWTKDSREGIEVALGRAGASKLQYLRLGKGTSQHVLISGKTGSGKSTLLHALITNVAIHYAPDEVEFYLIDFKKGVEFKPYAAERMPHARVIAIESEREFGMSVLERLDQELRVRGDLFRKAGVQDIRNFRDENPDQPMPRVLLIIDEFQEFFTQDDKLAQEAALLLDRLVRQGRAFGIHVLLGSQTLAGAYSLARSTLGQMAIRIALQCSEADSHLILSEDNTAARLLNRPGEAIYNDANGLFEGNHPFQVVWLSAADQDDYLQRLAARATEQQQTPKPLIVFEGNSPADPAENPLLHEAVQQPSGESLVPRAWLGAAVAIKDPTSVAFRRQSAANLLVVGQDEEMALGLLANCFISLLAQFRSNPSARFLILDGTRPESPESGAWSRLVHAVAPNLSVLSPHDASRVITEVHAEVLRRGEEANEGAPPVFLWIYNLSRFRDLRRSDDDLGFGGFGEEKELGAAKQLTTILRDGPALGVHTLLWCDTYNTLNRWFDRASIRELDQRVLFQMSANDSSNLMDSPAASRLGAYRAILFSEEQGTQEKFRPYGPPSAEWLQWVAGHLAGQNRSSPEIEPS